MGDLSVKIRFVLYIFDILYKPNYAKFNTRTLFGTRREKTCLQGFVNNKGSYQPAHRLSLISAFGIRLLENIISKLATGEILIFQLVSVAEETGFGNLEDRSCRTEAHL